MTLREQDRQGLFSAYSDPSKITYTNMSGGQWYTYNIHETHNSNLRKMY